MRKEFIVGAIAIVVLAGVGIWLTANASTKDETPVLQADTHVHSHDHPVTYKKADASTSKAIISYTNLGFTPSQTTIMSGDAITIVNSSTSNLDFASGTHPVHDNDPELSIPLLAPGDKVTLIVSRVGTELFHNHLKDSDTGTLVVSEK